MRFPSRFHRMSSTGDETKPISDPSQPSSGQHQATGGNWSPAPEEEPLLTAHQTHPRNESRRCMHWPANFCEPRRHHCILGHFYEQHRPSDHYFLDQAVHMFPRHVSFQVEEEEIIRINPRERTWLTGYEDYRHANSTRDKLTQPDNPSTYRGCNGKPGCLELGGGCRAVVTVQPRALQPKGKRRKEEGERSRCVYCQDMFNHEDNGRGRCHEAPTHPDLYPAGQLHVVRRQPAVPLYVGPRGRLLGPVLLRHQRRALLPALDSSGGAVAAGTLHVLLRPPSGRVTAAASPVTAAVGNTKLWAEELQAPPTSHRQQGLTGGGGRDLDIVVFVSSQTSRRTTRAPVVTSEVKQNKGREERGERRGERRGRRGEERRGEERGGGRGRRGEGREDRRGEGGEEREERGEGREERRGEGREGGEERRGEERREGRGGEERGGGARRGEGGEERGGEERGGEGRRGEERRGEGREDRGGEEREGEERTGEEKKEREERRERGGGGEEGEERT
ncbi:hypothetical protein INR49_020939, partial [Caranx melampygus]